MFKKNSWIAALLAVLSVSIFFIGCIDPLAEPAEDKGEYIEFVLTEFNLFGGNAENQQGWATKGSWDSKGKVITKDIGLTVEMLQQARYLVVEVNDGFPKNNFETIYDSFDAAGNKIGDWQQFGNITSSSGVLNPGMGERTGNTLKLPMDKIIKNYSTNFMDSNVAAISLYIQHWGNGGTGACIKSAKLLISNDPPPFYDAEDITLPGAGGSFTYQKEFQLSAATVEPSFASKQKILWSIRKWTNGTDTYDLDLAGTNTYEIAKAKAGIKSKVDFKTTYNENDEATQGRDVIVATDAAGSVGTVTLLATIKDAVYNETTEKYEDLTKRFTVSIIAPVPYIVPAAGTGYFYVDLNDWETQTPESANINANVPFVETAAGNITVPFTGGYNQRVNFKLTTAQRDLLMGIAAVDGKTTVTVNINATVSGTAGGTNDKFRYHIGDATVGVNWNATGSPAEGALSTITGAQVLEFGTYKSNATCSYLILQHRDAADITIVINSIRITYAPTVGGPSQIDVAFNEGNVFPGNNGTVVPAGDGTSFTFTYGTVDNSNYGNGIVRFKVDLGDAQLKDYEKITFTWTAVSGDVAGYKRLYLLATDTEASITPWQSDDAIKALVVSSTNINNFYDGDGPQVDGTDPEPVTLNIIVEKNYTGLVWFSIYLGATDGTYTISNLKFIPK